jgi:ketosteroid isomerase-like protein
MSQENVEIVGRAFSEFEKGNFGVPEFFDPDIRIVWLDVAGVDTETVGLQGMSETMRDWLEVYERLTMTAERLIDAGDQVVVIAAWHGRGKASGVSTDWRHGQVWTLRDGRVTSVIAYKKLRDALDAAGLRE